MTWVGPHKATLHKVHLKQKHAIRLICNKNKFTHPKPHMRSLQVMKVFLMNIQKIFVFMHRVKSCSNVPIVFENKFTYPSHRYLTHLSKSSKYKIFISDSLLWNKVLSSTEVVCFRFVWDTNPNLNSTNKKNIYFEIFLVNFNFFKRTM